jgi:hypothetical protein
MEPPVYCLSTGGCFDRFSGLAHPTASSCVHHGNYDAISATLSTFVVTALDQLLIELPRLHATHPSKLHYQVVQSLSVASSDWYGTKNVSKTEEETMGMTPCFVLCDYT